MTYDIEIGSTAEKSLKKIPKNDRLKIIEKIDELCLNPRPFGSKKLQGNNNSMLYRIRSGDYRIIYTIQDKKMLVLVIDVGHRKEIYR